jgi:hypothetical protein
MVEKRWRGRSHAPRLLLPWSLRTITVALERGDSARSHGLNRHWPIIAAADVRASSRWYARLLAARDNHPGASVFNQILDEDGTVLLCLHQWGPSGPGGDHDWP